MSIIYTVGRSVVYPPQNHGDRCLWVAERKEGAERIEIPEYGESLDRLAAKLANYHLDRHSRNEGERKLHPFMFEINNATGSARVDTVGKRAFIQTGLNPGEFSEFVQKTYDALRNEPLCTLHSR